MTQAEPITLDVRGLAVAAKAWGPADGPRVLGAHGWLDNANTWDHLVPHLPGLRLVSVDFPGHGLSDHRQAASPYHFLDLIAELSLIADALEWERFSLLGHSMGAGVSSMLAGTLPERIERMVLVEGLGPMVELPERAPERMADAIAQEKRRTGKRKRVFASLEDAASKIADVTRMEVSSAKTLLERGLMPTEGGLTWRADSRLRLPSRVRFSEQQVKAFMRRISCPTLLIRADDGWDYDPATMRARMECVPNLKLVELSGKHHLHLDSPRAVAEHVAPFFAPLFGAPA